MLSNTSGFVYYVAIAGITGTRSAASTAITEAVERLRRHTELPIAVGFGIKTPEQVAEIVEAADAAVVGSALVDRVKASLDEAGNASAETVDHVLGLVTELSAGLRKGGRG